MRLQLFNMILIGLAFVSSAQAQTNPLWREEKVKNYLPHMTTVEVQDLLTRTDMVVIPVPSLEQHGPHGPIGTDFYGGIEQAKLIAQRTDVLVAPILFVGQAGYHMGFPGTISLSAETIQRVYFEAAQGLIHHGFRRFLFLTSHTGNQHITRFVVDRINQETVAIAVDLLDAAAPFAGPGAPDQNPAKLFDRHAGVNETSNGLYLFPSIMALDKAQAAVLTLPPHLAQLLPDVKRGDPGATTVFLAEGLKPQETQKRTSAAEMSSTGAWSERDPKEATAAQGRATVERTVDASVRFIERWKQLRPLGATSR